MGTFPVMAACNKLDWFGKMNLIFNYQQNLLRWLLKKCFIYFSSCIDGVEAPGWNFVVMKGEVSWQSPDVTVLAQFQEAVIDQRHDELIENRCRVAELVVVDDWPCWPCWTHHILLRALTRRIQLDGNRVDGFVGLANRVGWKDQSFMSNIFNSIQLLLHN